MLRQQQPQPTIHHRPQPHSPSLFFLSFSLSDSQFLFFTLSFHLSIHFRFSPFFPSFQLSTAWEQKLITTKQQKIITYTNTFSVSCLYNMKIFSTEEKQWWEISTSLEQVCARAYYKIHQRGFTQEKCQHCLVLKQVFWMETNIYYDVWKIHL